MDRIVITGMGAISAVGIGRQNLWEGLVAGRDGVTEVESFDTSAYRTHRGGEVKGFQPPDGTGKMGRASQFLVYAAREALGDAGLDAASLPRFRTALSLGTTMFESQLREKIGDRVTRAELDAIRGLVPQAVSEALAANLARTLRVSGPVNLILTACAAGNYALAYGARLLRSRSVDIVLAGGSDPMSRIAYTGFNAMMAIAPERCQPFDRNRRGMVPGEGCAVLVMERESSARKRGVRIYGELAGYGFANDAHHMTAPHPEGCGAIRAMNQAMAAASILPEHVDYISAHGTGTAANDKVETLAVKRALGDAAGHTPVSSIKSMLGHTMGAASSLEAVACLLAIERGIVPPTINYEERDPECDLDYVPNRAREHKVDVAMSNAYAVGGHCSSIVLRRVS
jgi:3-oxoacyl-[acyl-carrier-protein] synthase II